MNNIQPFHSAIQLYNTGKFQESIRQFGVSIDSQVKSGNEVPPVVYDYLTAACYAIGDYQAALHSIQHALQLQPGKVELIHNLAALQIQTGMLPEAISNLKKCLNMKPDYASAWDHLARAYAKGDQAELARQTGLESLKTKDQLAHTQSNLDWVQRHIPGKLNDTPPVTSKANPPLDQIIAYSLWGNDPKYLSGAIDNAKMAPLIFPEWRCRFYCDESVPENVRKSLQMLGAQVRLMPRMTAAFFGLFWRFQVIHDPTVKRFLIRDVDSPLLLEEKAAVDQWLASPHPFHIIRDWITHTELILAGLWGGIQGVLPDLWPAIERFYAENHKERTIDQRFLRMVVWPLIKDHHLAHDSLFQYGKQVNTKLLARDFNQNERHIGTTWQGISLSRQPDHQKNKFAHM